MSHHEHASRGHGAQTAHQVGTAAATAAIPSAGHSLGYNLIWGTIKGVQLGFFFVILATVQRVLERADKYQSWGSTSPNYPTEVLTYLCGGIAGGVILGLLRRWITSAKAAALVGFLALLPASLRINADFNSGHLGVDAIYPALMFALAVGSPVGALVWFRVKDTSTSRGRRGQP